MSKFFKALERAQVERSLQNQARQEEAIITQVAPPQAEASPEDPPHAPTQMAAELPSVVSVIHRPVGKGIPSAEPELASTLAGEPPADMDEHLVSLLTPTSFEADRYRTLSHMVEQMQKNVDLHVLAVTSPGMGDGKTTTAINLAGALAQSPKARVLLVEVDLRRPSVLSFLGRGYVQPLGLIDAVLQPALCLEDVVRRQPPSNLAVLPAGHSRADSYEILRSPRMGELLNEARRRYDFVVLDTPPVTPFPDCRILDRWVDGFLMVVAAHKTPRTLLEEALTVVDSARIIGLVFNGDNRAVPGYYYYGYYGNGHSPDGRWVPRLTQAVMKVGGFFQRRRSSRRRSRASHLGKSERHPWP